MKRLVIVAVISTFIVAPARSAEQHRVTHPAMEKIHIAGDVAAALSAGDDPRPALERYRQFEFGPNAAGPQLFGSGPIDRQIQPAGDLDGDGAGDAIVTETYNRSTPLAWADLRTVVSGRSGRTGETLWAIENPNEFIYAFPAPAGPHAKPGVFLLATTLAGTWRLVALDANGAQRWEMPVASAVGYVFPLIVLDDGNGDGLSDVVVEQQQYESTTLDTFVFVVATVFDGADGSIESVLTTTSKNAAPELEAAGDVDGDGLTDLVAAAGTETAFEFTALRADGSTIWITHAEGGRWCFVEPGPDSDGDGHPDTIIWFPSMFDDAPADTVIMIAGGDGGVLWTGAGDFPRATHDVDGDGSVDVRIMRSEGASFWSPLALSFGARRGSDGAVISDVTYAVPPAAHVALRLIGDAGDADADGIGDWVFDVARYAESWDALDAFSGAISGGDGGLLWSARPGGPLYADIDGDGGADQIRGTSIDWRTLRLDSVRGPDGSTGWNRVFRLTSNATLLAVYPLAFDLTGDGVAEVVLNVWTAGPSAPLRGALFGDIVSQIFVVDGATGADLWTLG